jgi:uncharacterized protein YbjT (DUF2867 family)
MEFTFLRDNFYADLLPAFADESGVIRGPAGDGRVAAVARADVADVASVVLRDPDPHAGATHTLTGPEALTLTEVAPRAGAVLGRELRFENQKIEVAGPWGRIIVTDRGAAPIVERLSDAVESLGAQNIQPAARGRSLDEWRAHNALISAHSVVAPHLPPVV